MSDWYDNDETVDALRRVSTATLTTQLFRRGFRTRFMQDVAPLKPGSRMVGVARTLRYLPMREDLDTLATLGSRSNAQRALIEDFRPHEVLVIEGRGDLRAGSLGNILALRLQVRGAAGIVTDGAFRDSPNIRKLDIPSYAAGENANTNLTIYHPADSDPADRLRRGPGRARRRGGGRRGGGGGDPGGAGRGGGPRRPRAGRSRSTSSTSRSHKAPASSRRTP